MRGIYHCHASFNVYQGGGYPEFYDKWLGPIGSSFISILSFPDISHALLDQAILDIGLRKMSIQ